MPRIATAFRMGWWCRVWMAAVMAICALWPPFANAQQEGLEHFEKRVRPVLHRECLGCHHQGKASGSLALDSRAGLLKGGDSGPAVVPGDPESSLLIQAIRHQAEGLAMPAKAPRLAEDVIRAFETWVRQGAPDPRDQPESLAAGITAPWEEIARERAQWWCWQPLRAADATHQGTQAIDVWIDRGIAAAGITPSKSADRRTLIRRLSFQLCGLPPTSAEVEAFLRDTSPDAWARCIDRFLEKPDFGVHWARHWMDVVRYADTHGSEDDAQLPFAYRYRDYLIRALQRDLPYDALIREHLAGDLLPPRWNPELKINEALIGTAFLRFVEFNQTPVDVKREEIIVIDNQIDAIGKAFQGLTISCARCHDHKFDPISDEDYYALYGILRSTRVCQRIIDDPAVFDRDREQLVGLQRQIRGATAPIWLEQVSRWPEELEQARTWCRSHWKPDSKWDDLKKQDPPASWTFALAKALCQPKESPLGTLARLLVKDDAQWPAASQQFQRELAEQERQSQLLPEHAELLFDLTAGERPDWTVVGVGLSDRILTEAGAWAIAGGRELPFAGLLERGMHSNLVSDRHGGSLRSPDFVLDMDAISLLTRGSGQARARLVIENFQGDSLLFAPVNPTLESTSLRWLRMPIRPQWRGLRAHLELLTRDDKPYVGIIKDPSALDKTDGRSSFGIAKVVKHSRGGRMTDPPRLPQELAEAAHGNVTGNLDRQQWIAALCQATRGALERFTRGAATDNDARWLTVLMESQVLTTELNADTGLGQLIRDYRRLENAIPIARRVPGVHEDQRAIAQPWLPRGDHRKPGDEVARRYLEVLGSKAEKYAGSSSGRLRLAEEIANPQNPLTARVYVNRVWHWLFGRGLVPSVDNFGRMGEPPSHPELLDQLAAEFMRDGWSTKQLIRAILRTQAWQRSSVPTESASRIDPANRWWSHASVRRLDAESIRDLMLSVAGNLKSHDEGWGTLSFYRSVQEPNKQPPPGPLDGDGRRSIFLEVRRNYPNEFLLTFDFPRPAAPAGRRPTSLVPGQSLTLMNDPFVLHQSRLWAKRIMAAEPTGEGRVRMLYRDLLNREPTPDEATAAALFVEPQLSRGQEAAAWELMAHAMFNLKEAIYLP